jgi:CubicO group peptidase (beta-lactamase class C family)
MTNDGGVMKRFIAKLLVLIFVFPFVCFTVIHAQSGPELSAFEGRIKRVEQGLLPAVLIKGDPSWSIEERMKHHRVPGLSLAVINNHKIEWARSYGVKDIETREPVIQETLFQAGSISKPVSGYGRVEKSRAGKDCA